MHSSFYKTKPERSASTDPCTSGNMFLHSFRKLTKTANETLGAIFKDEKEVKCALYFNEADSCRRPSLRFQKTTMDPHSVHIRCDLQCYIPHTLSIAEIKDSILMPIFKQRCRHLIAAFERENHPDEVAPPCSMLAMAG